MSTHKPELDTMTPSQIRVICEQLLYTMNSEQRIKLMQAHPSMYLQLYPNSIETTLSNFQEHINKIRAKSDA